MKNTYIFKITKIHTHNQKIYLNLTNSYTTKKWENRVETYYILNKTHK